MPETEKKEHIWVNAFQIVSKGSFDSKFAQQLGEMILKKLQNKMDECQSKDPIEFPYTILVEFTAS